MHPAIAIASRPLGDVRRSKAGGHLLSLSQAGLTARYPFAGRRFGTDRSDTTQQAGAVRSRVRLRTAPLACLVKLRTPARSGYIAYGRLTVTAGSSSAMCSTDSQSAMDRTTSSPAGELTAHASVRPQGVCPGGAGFLNLIGQSQVDGRARARPSPKIGGIRSLRSMNEEPAPERAHPERPAGGDDRRGVANDAHHR
jgi:hypothetical protein